MPKLKFFDFKTRKSFETDEFEVEERGGRCYAIAKTPAGALSYRIISRVMYEELK